jgi:glutaminase
MYDGNDTTLKITQMLTAASVGDLMAIRNLHAKGVHINSADYDMRTAAHIAAAGGDLNVLMYLAEQGANLEAKDRWGGTPSDDARKNGHKKCKAMLNKWIKGDGGNDSIKLTRDS